MSNNHNFYIDGAWVKPVSSVLLDVIDPSTELAFTTISLGSQADIDLAVAAAKRALPSFRRTTKVERLDMLRRLLDAYNARAEDLAQALSREMGAPIDWARHAQVAAGRGHLETTIAALEAFEFETMRGNTKIVREGIGVAALITPWNWPLNQIATKVAPAIAAGATMVIKPSEIAPLSGIIFAEAVHEAGLPDGVFNLVNGDGPGAGAALSAHPDIAVTSFTGSTRAGVLVSKAGADTIKRISLELGGKSANIILDDANLEVVVREGVEAMFSNTGQSCDAPSRMLVPAALQDEVLRIAKSVAGQTQVGDPRLGGSHLGPVVSKVQFDKIQALIALGASEGAELITGGEGRPEGFDRGYYVRPTIFGRVSPQMTIAREEIFGPVLAVIPYDDEDEAVRIANDSVYGLAGYVQSGNIERARAIAAQLEAGTIQINGPDWDLWAPFGGYKQSGNGREYADYGIEEFLETKALVGYGN
jgi:aldehyde dehydrogenase (NAD+)